MHAVKRAVSPQALLPNKLTRHPLKSRDGLLFFSYTAQQATKFLFHFSQCYNSLVIILCFKSQISMALCSNNHINKNYVLSK